MKPTPIFKDHTGQWRPVNPYDVEDRHTFPFWDRFEQYIQYHDFPNPPEVKPGEVVMARLQWQYYGHKTGGAGPFWLDVEEDEYKLYKSYEHFKSFYENHRWGKTETRQIWVAVTDSAKEEEAKIDYQERIDKLKNQISHYKSQCDEMLALQQQKERELESLRQKYNEGLL